MHKLKIHSADAKGDLANECVWLEVLEDIPDLVYYLLCDTTYTDDKHISNELRHTFWFPKKEVRKGDWIKVVTKSGVNTTTSNNKNTTTHIFHWNLGKTVWNKDGDCAVLFKLETWKAKRV